MLFCKTWDFLSVALRTYLRQANSLSPLGGRLMQVLLYIVKALLYARTTNDPTNLCSRETVYNVTCLTGVTSLRIINLMM